MDALVTRIKQCVAPFFESIPLITLYRSVIQFLNRLDQQITSLFVSVPVFVEFDPNRELSPFESIQATWEEERLYASKELELPIRQLKSKNPKKIKEANMLYRERLIKFHTADAALAETIKSPKSFVDYKQARSVAYEEYMRYLDKLTRLSKKEPLLEDKNQYVKLRKAVEKICAKKAISFARADGALRAHVELSYLQM